MSDNDSDKWVSSCMTTWPCDATAIYEADVLKLYLGSIASALRVDEIDVPDLELVITTNNDDQLEHGCPQSWKCFFAEHVLANLRYGGYDEPRVWEHDWGHYLEKMQEFLAT